MRDYYTGQGVWKAVDKSENCATRFGLRMSQNLCSLNGGQQVREIQLNGKNTVLFDIYCVCSTGLAMEGNKGAINCSGPLR